MALIRSTLFRARNITPFARCISTTETLTLNFSMPHGSISHDRQVNLVQLPGVTGEFGVTAGHTPICSQLVPGVVQIHTDAPEPEKYFVSGGYAMLHPSNHLDIATVEAFKLDDFEPAAVSSVRAEANKKVAAASPDSVEAAEAQIELEAATNL